MGYLPKRLLVVMILVSALSRTGQAHPEWSPLRVNRYSKVVLAEPGRVTIIYTLLYGDGPGLALRKSADANGDGHLDEQERSALGARAQASVRAGLHLSLDGTAVSPALDGIDVGLAGDAVAPDPLSIDLRYHLDASADAPHELVLDDHVEVQNEGDTEVVVEAPGPTQLRAAFHGAAAKGGPDSVPREPLFAFRGPRFSALEDRRVSLRFVAPTTNAEARRLISRRDLYVVIAGLVAALLMALTLRRRR